MYLHQLPPEIILLIIQYLSTNLSDLYNLSLTSTTFNSLFSDNWTWFLIFQSRYPQYYFSYDHLPIPDFSDILWKECTLHPPQYLGRPFSSTIYSVGLANDDFSDFSDISLSLMFKGPLTIHLPITPSLTIYDPVFINKPIISGNEIIDVIAKYYYESLTVDQLLDYQKRDPFISLLSYRDYRIDLLGSYFEFVGIIYESPNNYYLNVTKVVQY